MCVSLAGLFVCAKEEEGPKTTLGGCGVVGGAQQDNLYRHDESAAESRRDRGPPFFVDACLDVGVLRGQAFWASLLRVHVIIGFGVIIDAVVSGRP